jgi:hypothetical protein
VKSSLPAGDRSDRVYSGRVHPGVVLSAMVCATAIFMTSKLTTAGPLDPPSGTIAPTYKTLNEVEPRIAINAQNTPGDASSVFKITKPGSYYLTGNVIGVSGKDGIVIAASNVTVDLMGFTLEGVAGSGEGIGSSGTQQGITIRNGVVMNWGATGVDLYLPTTTNSRVEHVHARGNESGIRGFGGMHFVGCIASGNTTIGIEAGNDAKIEGCTSLENGGDGFACGFGSTVSGSIARNNVGSGFVTSGDCVFSSCTATLNDTDGFRITRSVVNNCRAAGSERGFSLSQSAVHDSSAHNCQVGINMSSDSIATNCNLTQCTTAGIQATASDNRIENNNAVDCAIGFNITSAGNLIVRNSASGGVRYSIAAGNAAGPIINAAAVGTSLIPTANYDY